jgi:hypothetical protein
MALSLFSEPEFTLPHPSIHISVFLIVEDAVRVAWDILQRQPPTGFDMNTASEVQLNHHLQETLADMVWSKGLVPGFDMSLVSSISSGAEFRNYNKTKLQKKPDIFVRLTAMPVGARPSQYGIFIECKPVDKAHPLLSHYCDIGVERFVCGDYAWSMQEAMMVGYATDSRKVESILKTAFATRRKTIRSVGKPQNCDKSAVNNETPTVTSRHRRTFKYVETATQAPDISLRHIWLQR